MGSLALFCSMPPPPNGNQHFVVRVQGGLQKCSQDFLSGRAHENWGRPVSELDWQFSQQGVNNPTRGCTPLAMPLMYMSWIFQLNMMNLCKY